MCERRDPALLRRINRADSQASVRVGGRTYREDQLSEQTP
jgi:hypothetical protein